MSAVSASSGSWPPARTIRPTISRWPAANQCPEAAGSSPLAVAQRVLHLAGELLQAEGLGEEVDVRILVEPAAEIVLGVAGDEDDLHVGATGADLARQRRPVHPRHHHVGHHE